MKVYLRQRSQALLLCSVLTSAVSLWISAPLMFKRGRSTKTVLSFGNTLLRDTQLYGKKGEAVNQWFVNFTSPRDIYTSSIKPQALNPYFVPRRHKVNPYNYSFLIDGRDICLGEPPFLLIVVPSALYHNRERQTVRETWARAVKTGIWADGTKLPRTKLVFLLAMSYNSNIFSKLRHESLKYGDIVLADFVDSYRNLTLKSMSALYWTTRFCPEAKYLLKNDEDTIVHLPRLVQLLSNNFTNTIIGREGHQLRVIRHGRIPRWNIPKDEYPLDHYPPYILGNYYIISNDLIPKLFHLSQYIPFLSVEDVFITGIVRVAVHAELKNLDSCFLACDFSVVNFAYAVYASQVRAGWRELSKHRSYTFS